MTDKYLHETASVQNSSIGNVKLYRNVLVRNSVLGDNVSVGDDTTVERCRIDSHVALNRRNYINDTHIGAFTYTGIGTIVNWSEIGKFCSIARNTDIGGMSHDYHKFTTMPLSRMKQITGSESSYSGTHTENHPVCRIGNDVWIAANAQIMGGLTVGDGAVIGGGAVVTHDVPPYAVVAGVPAKIIGWRCEQSLIPVLLQIRWWDWSEDYLIRNFEILSKNDITEENVQKLLEISKTVHYAGGKKNGE